MARRTNRTLGALVVVSVLAVGATAAHGGTPSSSSSSPSSSTSEGVPRGTVVDRHLEDDDITESSGLARSTYARRLLWTHNDSGDSARLFAVRPDGSTLAVLRLEGAGAVDWEDISTGPGHSIWVGDIGDNGWSRDRITVYRISEPVDPRSEDVAWTSYDFRYEDGPRDAEALMVRPRTGRVFVVSKDEAGGDIYRAPRHLSTSSVNTLRRVASAPHTVTGASFAPDGDSFVLINYTRSYVFSRVGGSVRSETSKVNNSSQGESVEIGRTGKRLLLGQEGSNSPVYATPYRSP